MDISDRPKRRPGEGREDFMQRRLAWGGAKPAVRVERVETVREVERVVYRDRPAVSPDTVAMLEKAKARIDGDGPRYNFRTEFLEQERAEGEDLSETDRKLISDYADLEVRRPLGAADEARRQRLFRNLYKFRG